MRKQKILDQSKSFTRLIYMAMVLIAILSLIFLKDLSNATITFALALAFDPFDQSQEWKKRPIWQRIWLGVHLLIAVGMLGLLLSGWEF
ncbi:hypothetical protein SAMN00777080_4395 [Aquiflexum balticum DSM 16537]|uniref:Uncharacterized protein n=1 Tax=Aquiflexum balticum DSM 16537 TaxID=758820 RepID=A0A1W2HAH4_9BACT|nr:hypothetical protein [Aquiflexum balticum]SMD45732.1 hypothetical protein SAMN00777080_4395 [Aquiflexum balticum DSM 16537]